MQGRNLLEQRRQELCKEAKRISFFLLALCIVEIIIWYTHTSPIHLLLGTLMFVSVGGEAIIQLDKKIKSIERLTSHQNPRS